MATNPYSPPNADLQIEPKPKGLSHWITIPVGLVLTYFGVFGFEPMLVDLIIQKVLSIPETNRQVPMLSLDLVLSTLTLTGIFTLIQWPSRPPKARAPLVVASILFVFTALLYFSPQADHPLWYKVLILASIFLAWWLSKEELSAFVGKMAHPGEWQSYRDKKSIHAGFNGWAALFGSQWFLCRRLYWQAVFAVAIELGFPLVVIAFTTAITGDEINGQHQMLLFAIGCLAILLSRIVNGFWANLALYKKAVKEISKIDALNLDNEMHLKMISNSGSLNVGILVILYISAVMLRLVFESMN